MTEQHTATPHVDANDVLFGGGSSAPALKFDQPGLELGGKIVSPPQARQEREYDPFNPGKGALKFFPSGDPIMGIVVDVQTNERTDADDNGVRRIYVEGKRIKDAVRQAVIDSGGRGLEVGGELYVAFTGYGTPSAPGVNAPKLYAARYVPAATAALGVTPPAAPAPQQPAAVTPAPTPAPTPAAPAPAAAPAAPAPAAAPAAPAPAAPANGPTAEQIANLQAAGINPATVFPGWTPSQQAG